MMVYMSMFDSHMMILKNASISIMSDMEMAVIESFALEIMGFFCTLFLMFIFTIYL